MQERPRKPTASEIRDSRRYIYSQLSDLARLRERKDIDPSLIPFLATFCEPGFVRVTNHQDFINVYTNNNPLDTERAALAMSKTAVMTRDLEGNPVGVSIKEELGLRYPAPSPYGLLTITEELGHLATNHIEKCFYGELPDDPNRFDFVAVREAANYHNLGAGDRVLLSGYNCTFSMPDATFEPLPAFRIYEELRAQIIAMYSTCHIFANKTPSRLFREGALIVGSRVHNDQDHKGIATHNIGNIVGWDNLIPICVNGNLHDFFDLTDKHPHAEQLSNYMDLFFAAEQS
ncbi:MAG: hypothetical protein U0525_05170 [Patescibacteria group bacterium]